MNSIGKIFKIAIYGESHGKGVGVTIDGVPPGIEISKEDFTDDLLRRKSDKKGTTKRKEVDIPEIQSGIFKDKTTGTPVNIFFENRDVKSESYKKVQEIPRPGHADFTAKYKYKGFNDYRGGGMFSGRLTAGIVAAGVIAKKLISPVNIKSDIIEIGGKKNYKKILKKAIKEKDSLGGIIECSVNNISAGLGEPYFDSVESIISHMIFSIPGIIGIEFGKGFNGTRMRGSEFNDSIINKEGKTETNNCGGVNGGITNGNQLLFRAAVKPTPTISKKQKSFNLKKEEITEVEYGGRHDAAFILRMPVIIEAAVSIVLADLILINK